MHSTKSKEISIGIKFYGHRWDKKLEKITSFVTQIIHLLTK